MTAGDTLTLLAIGRLGRQRPRERMATLRSTSASSFHPTNALSDAILFVLILFAYSAAAIQ